MAQLNDFAKLKILNYRFSLLIALEILGQVTHRPKEYWINYLAECSSKICQTITDEQLEAEINSICEE